MWVCRSADDELHILELERDTTGRLAAFFGVGTVSSLAGGIIRIGAGGWVIVLLLTLLLLLLLLWSACIGKRNSLGLEVKRMKTREKKVFYYTTLA